MSKSLDRLTLLQTFVRIADAGSISAAARDLGLSQPSASRQLAELEQRFQAQLIQRTTHSLSLTPAGLELLADARRLLEGWEALEEKYLDPDQSLRGQLKVVAPVALGQLHLLDIALQFQQQHPAISLSWQLEDQEIRFAEVGCDCWIKIGPIPDPSLVVESLGHVERLMVAAPQLLQVHFQPTAPGDLNQFPCVALAPFEGGKIPLTSSGEKAAIAPPVCMTTNNIFALRRAALAGLGIAVMPRWFIESELKAGQLLDLLPTWRAPRLGIQVATAPGRYQPQKLSRFLQQLRASMATIPGVE